MDLLEQTFLGNTYQAWLIAVGAGLLVVVGLRTLQSLTRRRLTKLAARTSTRWDDYVVTMISGTKLLFWLVACHGGLIVLAAIQIGILYSSMIMDAVDESELATGLRQEGIFVSAIAFTSKAVSGLGNFVGGFLLDAIGFPRGAEQAAVGAVGEQQVVWLGLVQGPGMMLL